MESPTRSAKGNSTCTAYSSATIRSGLWTPPLRQMAGDADADFTARCPRGRIVRSQNRALCQAYAARNRASSPFSRGNGASRTVLRLRGLGGAYGRARAGRAQWARGPAGNVHRYTSPRHYCPCCPPPLGSGLSHTRVRRVWWDDVIRDRQYRCGPPSGRLCRSHP
jgi:hypothetical protein